MGKFKTGDVVRLKGAGPLMTVGEVKKGSDDDDQVVCKWFGGNTLFEKAFLEGELKEEEE